MAKGSNPNSKKNLKQFDTLTPEEAKEIRAKGGKARGEKIRERKKIKEDLLLMLETVMSNGKTTQENWMSALAKNLLKGDMSTAIFVRDTIGEKPVDNVKVDLPINIDIKDDFE